MKRRATADIKSARPTIVKADLCGGFSESIRHSLTRKALANSCGVIFLECGFYRILNFREPRFAGPIRSATARHNNYHRIFAISVSVPSSKRVKICRQESLRRGNALNAADSLIHRLQTGDAVPLLIGLRRSSAAGLQFSGDLYLAATRLHCPLPRHESRLLD